MMTFSEVFSKIEKSPKTRIIQAGERVEIYRPLINDPKEMRKVRAAKAKENKTQSDGIG